MLDNLISELKAERDKLAEVEKEVAKLKELLDQTDAWKAWNGYADVKRIQQGMVDELEKRIKRCAEEQYAQIGEKHLHDKVEIKLFDTIDIVDVTEARKWANENYPEALKLDVKSLGKAIKELSLGWFVKRTEARAQISSKL